MQSEDQHHQPRLRGTGCAHLTTGRDIHSPGARPIIFVLQSVIPVDFKELHPSLFPSNWKQTDDFFDCVKDIF